MIIANTSHSKNKGIKGIQRAMDIKIFLGIPRAMVQQPSKLQYICTTRDISSQRALKQQPFKLQ